MRRFGGRVNTGSLQWKVPESEAKLSNEVVEDLLGKV